jgi:glycosyltransferase involved in cell wall biosynthesis
MRKMSLLHIGKFYPPHAGGMETHLKALATRQSKSLDVEVIVANDSLRTSSAVVDGVSVVRVCSLGVFASVPVCPTLVKQLRTRRPDIVHLHLPNPGAAAGYLLSGHTGALVLTHHSDILGRKQLRRVSDRVMQRVMERASAIIVTSHRYAETSPELLPFLDKCKVVPLGFDPATLGPRQPDRSRHIQKTYGKPLLISVGRLVPYKGFEYLIRAMARVPGNLLIIGTGPSHGRLKQLIEQLRLGDRVHLLGYVDDLRPYYDVAEIAVVPSITRAEAFGIVQLEAMFCGKPIINTNLDSGVPEVSRHGETGLTVSPADEVALADAINQLLSDADMCRRMGAAGKSRVASEFDFSDMVRRTAEVYKSALSGAASTVPAPAKLTSVLP